MAKKLAVINQLRPRIVNQQTVGLAKFAERIAKNTTFHVEEINGMLRMCVREMNAALQAGETVKIDGLVSISPNMKIGGDVDMVLRGDRGTLANLNNPLLWTAGKVSNHEHLSKTTEQLIAFWNEMHPDDPVETEEVVQLPS